MKKHLFDLVMNDEVCMDYLNNGSRYTSEQLEDLSRVEADVPFSMICRQITSFREEHSRLLLIFPEDKRNVIDEARLSLLQELLKSLVSIRDRLSKLRYYYLNQGRGNKTMAQIKAIKPNIWL